MEEPERILYDLSVPQEWPEVVSLLNEDGHKSIWKIITSVVKAFRLFSVELLKNPTRLFGMTVTPSVLVDLINSRLSWQLVISSDGRQLAVIQEDCIEIRSVLDDFEVVRASIKVDKDIQPQWRKALWNHEGTLLVYASSKGEVSLITDFTQAGKLIHKILQPNILSGTSEGSPLETAVSGLLFFKRSIKEEEEVEKTKQTFREFLVVMGYNAQVTTFQLISGSHVKIHTVSLLNYFPCGVGAIDYISDHNQMIVAGWSEKDSPLVSCWRLIDDHPYWKPFHEEIRKFKRGGFKKLIGKKTTNEQSIFSMTVNSSQKCLATLSLSGEVSVWELPSCKLKMNWKPEELPGMQDSHKSISLFKNNSRTHLKDPIVPLEISWWSDQALILVNSVHQVTVVSIPSLNSLLGPSPEPGAAITPACNGQFLMLECESYEQWTRRRRLLPSLSEYSEDEEEEEDGREKGEDKLTEEIEDSFSLRKKILELTKQTLYFVTEREQFKPPKEKQKQLIKKYRLVCLKSMSPEESYERKMMNEEYGEALALAKGYGLDCDLVYQHQWQKSNPISVAAIKDYLSRVNKKSWILQECLHCVADDFLTMKELLLFGLHCTSFSEFQDLREEDIMEELCQDDEDEKQSEEMVDVINNWRGLTEDQIFMCQCRETLLQYLDRLNTYEVILGGPAATFELYDKHFFKDFRNQNLVRAVMEYAQDGNYSAVEALFSRHGDTILPHRLAIIANFPETLSPKRYSYLLPSISDDDIMEEWEREETRDKDWVEHTSVRKLYSLSRQLSSGDFIYEENPEWNIYLASPVTNDLLTIWYINRATEIEEYSGQINNALCLIEYGIDNGIKGLEFLHHHLRTLHSLIYFCNVDIRLSLTKLQTMEHLEVLQLIMKEIEEKDFMKQFTQHAIPYMNRLNKLDSIASINLLEQFMVIISKNDLTPCVALLQSSKKMMSFGGAGLQLSSEQKISIALKCIQACERSDQLDEADSILECLPTRSGSAIKLSGKLSNLHKQLDELEDFMSAADILKKYDVLKPIHYVRDIQNNVTESEQLLVKLTRVASRRSPPMDEKGWRGLLKDLLMLRNRVFNCVNHDTCYKIFAESLLCSGNVDNIMIASQILTVSPSSLPKQASITHLIEGFDHILPFDVSVDVVVMATQEYINSAATREDTEIELAKMCLSLIKSDPLPFKIISEMNFMFALDILNEFGISILPIHVRLCENKLDLIRRVLDSSSSAYKKYDKIFKLSYLLGLSSESETSLHDLSTWSSLSDGRGYTVIVITLSAIQNRDFKLAYRLCNVLIRCRFPHSWEVCKILGIDVRFTDKRARLDLLNFALCYCPVEEIKIILNERRVIEIQLLHDECHENQELEGGAVRQLVGRSSHTFQHLVSRGAGTVSQLVGQKKLESSKVVATNQKDILTNCLQHLKEMSEKQRKDSIWDQPLLMSSHPFYSAMTQDSKPITYSLWQEMTGSLKITLYQSMIYIQNSLKSLEINSEDSTECQNTLIQLCTEFCDKDIHLVTGYLLSLDKPDEADKICSLLPPSRLSYQLPIYYCCLHLYIRSTGKLHNRSHPYDHNPSTLIRHVMQHVTTIKQSDWPDPCQPFLQLLNKYKQKLDDHLQAQTLENLGLDIDVQQFTQDTSYRKMTILSLARNQDIKVLKTSVSLACRHEVSKWEVFMTHLDWLLTESGFTAEEINRRIGNARIMQLLLTQPQQMVDRLTEQTYPKLPSTRYSLMYEYFTYLQWCVEHGAVVNDSVKIETHLKLLKKFKSTIRGVNYQQLMSGADPLSLLLPSLWEHTVHTIAKLAKHIPLKDNENLTAAMVYRVFVEKVFWQQPETQTTDDWCKKLQSCDEYITRLSADQLEVLVLNLVFSSLSLQLSLDTRNALMDRLIENCTKRQLTKSQSQSNFAELLKKLTIYKQHLETLVSLSLQSPDDIDKELWIDLVQEYDLSLAQPEKISTLVQRVCILGLPIMYINSFLHLSNSTQHHTMTVKSTVQQSLQSLLDKESGDDLSNEIEKILMSVSTHEKKEQDKCLVTSSDVLEVLKPVCSSTKHSNLNKTLLHLLSKYLSLSQEDFNLLLLYQSLSILSSNFSNIDLSTEDISTSEGQSKLFFSLLERSASMEQLQSLTTLLQTWPNSSISLSECWSRLIIVTAGNSHVNSGKKAITIRTGLRNFDSKVDEEIFNILLKSDKMSALQLALISPNQGLLSHMRKMIEQMSQEEVAAITDSTTIEIILHQKHLPKLINTPIYSFVCSHLCNLPSDDLNDELLSRLLCCSEGELKDHLCLSSLSRRLNKTAKELEDAGLTIEAGSLLLLVQESHPLVKTVNNAFQIVKKQFK